MIKTNIVNMSKSYGNVLAIKKMNLEIKENEILAIVGPSGCGKSTLLKTIAGLEEIDSGSISIDEEKVDAKSEKIFVEPENRRVGLVFQSYALWPHYTVFENIAYSLKIKKLCSRKIGRLVDFSLKTVHLEGKEKKYPNELSGGEQQRVALARALVMNPRLLLLDEPLSNLDAKLREKMQYEIKRIQKETRLTIIHVTHDQYEAMGIADRIAIMNEGELVQIGTPKNIYDYPKNRFVANFIGKSNLIYGNIISDKKNRMIELFDKISIKDEYSIANESRIVLSIRPENISLHSEKGLVSGKITSVVYRGSFVEYIIDIYGKSILVQSHSQTNHRLGEKTWLTFDRIVRVDE